MLPPSFSRHGGIKTAEIVVHSVPHEIVRKGALRAARKRGISHSCRASEGNAPADAAHHRGGKEERSQAGFILLATLEEKK